MASASDEIEHYLRTGEHDVMFAAWPGDSLLDRASRANAALRRALMAEVRARTAHAMVPEALVNVDVMTFARRKVEPMVRGLFPAAEQHPVLDLLSGSVVFLTPVTIEPVLTKAHYHGTAWRLANVYLMSCGAPLFADDAPQLLGFSEWTTCYVSMAYFQPINRLDDVLVHEAAHVFHNCKRVTVGLPETRRREWLLDLAFSKRETFAYACEAYSRIVALGDSAAARRKLLEEVEAGPMPSDDSVDADEYRAALRGAVSARNGWKRILNACAPLQSQHGSRKYAA